MGVIDNAVTRALEIAANDSHGYDLVALVGQYVTEVTTE